jgi:ribonuclease HI
MKTYTIYTDGACSRNPGRGGYAFVILEDGRKIYEGSGAVPDTTNNRMELMAAIRAVDTIIDLVGNKEIAHAVVISDSKYVVDGINRWIHGWLQRGWENKEGGPVKNSDLWLRLYTKTNDESVSVSFEFLWMRGHQGDEWNDYVDNLAVEAVKCI